VRDFIHRSYQKHLDNTRNSKNLERLKDNTKDNNILTATTFY